MLRVVADIRDDGRGPRGATERRAKATNRHCARSRAQSHNPAAGRGDVSTRHGERVDGASGTRHGLCVTNMAV